MLLPVMFVRIESSWSPSLPFAEKDNENTKYISTIASSWSAEHISMSLRIINADKLISEIKRENLISFNLIETVLYPNVLIGEKGNYIILL